MNFASFASCCPLCVICSVFVLVRADSWLFRYASGSSRWYWARSGSAPGMAGLRRLPCVPMTSTTCSAAIVRPSAVVSSKRAVFTGECHDRGVEPRVDLVLAGVREPSGENIFALAGGERQRAAQRQHVGLGHHRASPAGGVF